MININVFEDMLDEHLGEVSTIARAAYEEAFNQCESPIEQALLPHLFFLRPGWLAGRYGGPLDYGIEMRLVPQLQVGAYRVDFAMVVRPIWQTHDELRIAIECDGHDYHSSKEQKAHDDARRIELQSAGFWVMDFPGTEIYRDAKACAAKVAEKIDRHFADRLIATVTDKWKAW